MRSTMAAVAFGAMTIAGVQAAGAAGFALREQSAIDQGTAYAGATARADDPATLFFNPAGMAKLPGYQVSLNASYIDPQATLTSAAASRGAIFGNAPVAGTFGNDAGIDGKAIGSIFATAQVAPDWHVGLAVTVPYGLTTKYPADSLARYYGLTTSLITVNVAPSVAWQILPTLSVAATLQIETADTHLSNAVDFGGIGAAMGLARFGFLPGAADGIATFKGSDVALGWQISALYEPVPGTRVGVNYRSAIFHDLRGSGQFQNVPGPFQTVFSNQPGRAKLTEPDSVTLGVAQDFGRWTLLADASWTDWSRFKTLAAYFPTAPATVTPENWHDTYFISAGADYRVTDALTLRAGTAFDSSVTGTSTRTPRVPDSNRYWLSVGATYRPLKYLAVSAAYSHLFGDSVKLNLTDSGPGTVNFLRGNLTGTYDTAVDIVSIENTLSF